MVKLHHSMKRHLSTLSILHYVYGAFVCIGGFAAFMFIALGMFLSSDFVAAESGGDAVPGIIGTIIQSFGWVILVVVELWGVFNILSGYWISRRSNRTATQVIAAFNCLNIPFGIALGLFTFAVLSDDEVKQEYNSLPTAMTA